MRLTKFLPWWNSASGKEDRAINQKLKHNITSAMLRETKIAKGAQGRIPKSGLDIRREFLEK